MVKFIVLLFLQMMMKKQCDAVNEVECKVVNKKELKNEKECPTVNERGCARNVRRKMEQDGVMDAVWICCRIVWLAELWTLSKRRNRNQIQDQVYSKHFSFIIIFNWMFRSGNCDGQEGGKECIIYLHAKITVMCKASEGWKGLKNSLRVNHCWSKGTEMEDLIAREVWNSVPRQSVPSSSVKMFLRKIAK